MDFLQRKYFKDNSCFCFFFKQWITILTHLLNLAYLYSVSKQIFKLHYDTMEEKNPISAYLLSLCVSLCHCNSSANYQAKTW